MHVANSSLCRDTFAVGDKSTAFTDPIGIQKNLKHQKIQDRFFILPTKCQMILISVQKELLTLHSSMVPNELNIIRRSCSVNFLQSIPTKSFRSSLLFSESAGFI